MQADAAAQPDEYPEKITYKRTAPGGKKPVFDELNDIPAKRTLNIKNAPPGTVLWHIPGGTTLVKVSGPKVDDTIIDSDGVRWTVTKVQGGGERWSLNTVKAKEQPKKP